MTRRAHAGFTLIELMVALAIAVILLVIAAPAYVRWMADAETQSGAASVAEGIRRAQAEAIKRNENVEFALNPSAGWQVQLQGTTTALDRSTFSSGSAQASFAAAPAGAAIVTFSPLGRVWTDDGTPSGKNQDGSDPLTQVDVSNSAGSRSLRVVLGGSGGAARVCDPAWDNKTPPDPRGCI